MSKMSEQEDKSLAFEYVMGTLRGKEREAFLKRLDQDNDLAEEVRFWEEQMMVLSESVSPLEPKAGTWNKIQQRINPVSSETTPLGFWQRLLPWQMTASVVLVLLLTVTLVYFNGINKSLSPNADYVAVLVNDQEQPILTALTAVEGSKLWLKWENWQTPEGHSLQLWAKSRRDGEVRPLIVFDESELKEIVVDEATLRLIKDSSHLIMTEEEVGGSAIDEPSEKVIASGVCIRLKFEKDA